MNKIIKTLSIMLVLAVMLVFTACGSEPTPSDAVKTDIDKVKSEQSTDTALKALDLEEGDLKEDDQKAFVAKMQDFDYEIVEEKVDEDKATVKVKITTYDFGKAMEELYTELFTMAFTNPDASTEEVTKMFMDKMTGIEKKEYTKEVTVNCQKKDGEWVTDVDSNEELQDAILGGLITKIDEINSMWEE